jgi:hypothetical protein
MVYRMSLTLAFTVVFASPNDGGGFLGDGDRKADALSENRLRFRGVDGAFSPSELESVSSSHERMKGNPRQWSVFALSTKQSLRLLMCQLHAL